MPHILIALSRGSEMRAPGLSLPPSHFSTPKSDPSRETANHLVSGDNSQSSRWSPSGGHNSLQGTFQGAGLESRGLYPGPYFDKTPKAVSVQVGSQSYLMCRVKQLDDKSSMKVRVIRAGLTTAVPSYGSVGMTIPLGLRIHVGFGGYAVIR
ncbi:unnamed protein product [Notodromas monacha]|uniref:Uncharacterized protein n=1 Tax=Notodromas monacha TaxID=399045 RepID=A0A7R9G7V8_9CRUS|nr:unnamed protein product [Notodromas monacha]CAG0912620.1 unnamed protein product [Notodromas monacha]